MPARACAPAKAYLATTSSRLRAATPVKFDCGCGHSGGGSARSRAFIAGWREQLLDVTLSDPIGVPEAALELPALGNELVQVELSCVGLVIDRQQVRSTR